VQDNTADIKYNLSDELLYNKYHKICLITYSDQLFSSLVRCDLVSGGAVPLHALGEAQPNFPATDAFEATGACLIVSRMRPVDILRFRNHADVGFLVKQRQRAALEVTRRS
jgi:hypothetical protein